MLSSEYPLAFRNSVSLTDSYPPHQKEDAGLASTKERTTKVVHSAKIHGQIIETKGFKFTNVTSVEEGQVSRKEDSPSSLQNVFVETINPGSKASRTIIRHGKVHHNDAKKQFKALILHLKNTGQLVPAKNGRFRVTSTSLLASLKTGPWEKEKAWVEFQHASMNELKEELAKEGIDLVHLHYQVHNSVYFEETLGENLSLKINSQGLTSYVNYFLEEIGTDVHSTEANQLREILKNNPQAIGSKSFIDFLLAFLSLLFLGKPASAESNGAEEIAQLKNLKESADPKIRAMAHALHTLISGNRNRGSVTRHQEIIALAVLNHALGINSAYNCKSGVDRTGLVHATESAISEIILKDGWDAVLPLVSGFEANADILDEDVKDLNASEYDRHMLMAPKEHQQIALFRELVYKNLMQIGKPIVEGYTGVSGFKFGDQHFIKPFCHPLVARFMPRFVKIEETCLHLQLTGEGNSLEGKVGLTREGRAHLIDRSAERSA